MRKSDSEGVRVVTPPNIGWLEKKLSTNEVDYLWDCINNRGKSYKGSLAGNIHESNTLVDESDWFYEHTLLPLCYEYECQFKPLGSIQHGLFDFWVNYQKQTEFNPSHNHGGIYSFVVWMKIPTRHIDQNQNPIASNARNPRISSFQFSYTNTLGKIQTYTYQMNPEAEGIMLLFPSELRHQVYPFYNCNEDRISVSGNIL